MTVRGSWNSCTKLWECVFLLDLITSDARACPLISVHSTVTSHHHHIALFFFGFFHMKFPGDENPFLYYLPDPEKEKIK